MRLALLGIACLSAACAADFEVASIKVHTGPLRAIKTMRISGSRVTLDGYTIAMLVAEAFDMPDYRIITEGLKNSAEVSETYYDIGARVPGDNTPVKTEVRAMIESMLRNRFHAEFRNDKREFSVDALVPDRRGASLKQSPVPPATAPECSAHVSVGNNNRLYSANFENCLIADLVNVINRVYMGRDVIDATGLAARYDLRVSFTPEWLLSKGDEPGDVALGDALRALGLRLEPRKAMLDVVVVERAGKPDEN